MVSVVAHLGMQKEQEVHQVALAGMAAADGASSKCTKRGRLSGYLATSSELTYRTKQSSSCLDSPIVVYGATDHKPLLADTWRNVQLTLNHNRGIKAAMYIALKPLAALKPLVSLIGHLAHSADRQTKIKYCSPCYACAPRVKYMRKYT